jgi:hypothetical protein
MCELTLSVYRASNVYGNVCTVAALCWSWMESAEPLRALKRELEQSRSFIDLSWGLLPSVCSLH